MENYMQNNESGSLSSTTDRNNFKMDERPNVRPETIKLLTESIGSKVLNTGLGNIFLNLSPKTRNIKVKINIWDYKSFCTIKEITGKTKRQPTERERRCL